MHFLKLEEGNPYKCVSCGNQKDDKRPRWGCKDCDYFVCPECYNKYGGSPLIGPKGTCSLLTL